jgi:hypothetical protein
MWRSELAVTAECPSIERLAGDLTAAERSHVAHCVRCQAEQSLFNALEADEPVPGEGASVQWIAAETKRRVFADAQATRAVKAPWWRIPRFALMAAGLVLVVGAAALLWPTSAGVDGTIPSTVYRAAMIDVVSPVGDVSAAPTDLQWKVVPGAVRYDVRLAEVDGTEVWAATAFAPRVDLPANIQAVARPAKTLVWTVIARDDAGRELATSGETRFRVGVTP